LDPLSFTLNNNLGVILYLAGDLERAEQCAKESLTVEPDFAPAHALYGMIHERRRQYVDAVSYFRQGLVYSPGHSFMKGRLGHALALSGERAKAAELVAEMVDRRDPSNYSDVHIAYIYQGLGDSGSALKHLDRAYQRRDPDLPYISVDPIFEPLREDSHFVEVLHKIGLPGRPS
jgi:adenylate cyclase